MYTYINIYISIDNIYPSTNDNEGNNNNNNNDDDDDNAIDLEIEDISSFQFKKNGIEKPITPSHSSVENGSTISYCYDVVYCTIYKVPKRTWFGLFKAIRMSL